MTFIAYAAVKESVKGPSADLIGAILYPVGFIFINMGRYQLYTENTLPPVALLFTRLSTIPALLRVWAVVLLGNTIGAAIGVYILANTGVFSPETAQVAAGFGLQGLETKWWDLFFKAIFAGGLVAGLVWIDHASRESVSRLFVTYITIFTIPAANLNHVVVSLCDTLYLFFTGQAGLVLLLAHVVVPVFLGNTIGGVALVTMVNYAQTREHRFAAVDESAYIYSIREMFFGRRQF
ncbi:MAG: formate/nitrite transporter family protein [Thermodesulfobacteriota bacterium]